MESNDSKRRQIRCVYTSLMQANYIRVKRKFFLNISLEMPEERLYKQLDIVSGK